jgi:multidrug resistance efflux pump
MKNEEERDVGLEWEGTAHRQSVIVRVLLLIALLFALIGAVRWAIHITNANAKQVSGNLLQIEKKLSTPSPSLSGPIVQVNSGH